MNEHTIMYRARDAREMFDPAAPGCKKNLLCEAFLELVQLRRHDDTSFADQKNGCTDRRKTNLDLHDGFELTNEIRMGVGLRGGILDRRSSEVTSDTEQSNEE